MMNSAIGVVAVAAGIGLGSMIGSAASAESWYAQRVTQSETGLGVEHLWSKGPSLRTEVVIAGHPIVTVVHGDRYWAVDGITGEGVSVTRSPQAVAASQKGGRPFGDEVTRIVAQGGEFIRNEPLGGEASCKLYKLTDDRGRQEVCVQEELELPVFLRNWDRATNREAVTRYVNWIRDLETRAGFFDPDPRYKLKNLTYEAFLKAVQDGSLGMTPILYPHLLHGDRDS